MLQSRVVDQETKGVEVRRNQLSGQLHSVHSDGHGFDPSQQQERVEWRQTRPNRVDEECNLFTNLRVGNCNDTSHEIVVAREVLCGRIVNNIDAEVKRSLEIRGHHGVVDDDQSIGVGSLDGSDDCSDVGNLEQRVGR